MDLSVLYQWMLVSVGHFDMDQFTGQTFELVVLNSYCYEFILHKYQLFIIFLCKDNTINADNSKMNVYCFMINSQSGPLGNCTVS